MWKLLVVCLCLNTPMEKQLEWKTLDKGTFPTYEQCELQKHVTFLDPQGLDLRGLACVKQR